MRSFYSENSHHSLVFLALILNVGLLVYGQVGAELPGTGIY
jgi:hypothetical protein